MTIELVPLCTATITLKDPMLLPNTPSGMRTIIEVATAKLEGDRPGMMAGAGPPATTGPVRCTVDVRMTFETHDGVSVRHLGVHRPVEGTGPTPGYAAPSSTSATNVRLKWVQAVAKGKLDGPRLAYDAECGNKGSVDR
jgi:hypothetical protein